ncbi:hypothetical protein CRG98_012541 [Punica granatum]|uniref:Uncharacterized protein n=1 Tax=Punica granatum TaxID=22663 RepID=A0A2I0KFP1_PUNGR|nr:hypothetical protein CRG98_012541 [Punica granatum]
MPQSLVNVAVEKRCCRLDWLSGSRTILSRRRVGTTGCRVLRDTSFRVERLRIPSGRESKSVASMRGLHGSCWPYGGISRRSQRCTNGSTGCSTHPSTYDPSHQGALSRIGEPIRDRVGVDNLAISLGDPWSAQSRVYFAPVSLFETPRFCIAEAALVCFARGDLDLEACLMHSEVELRVLRSCTLYKYTCLSIETVALKVCGSFGRFRLRLHRGYPLSGPSPLKYRKKDPIGVLREESASCPGGRFVAIAEGGLGHALFVGAVACDLSWREGWPSVFGVQGGGGEVFPISIVVVWDSNCLLVGYFLQWEKWKNSEGERRTVCSFNARAKGIELAWHVRTTRKDAFGCAGGCAQLREEMCARSRNDAWLRGVNEKLGFAKEGGSVLGPQLALPWREGEVWCGSERAPSEVVVGRPVPHLSQQLTGEGVPVLVCGDSVGSSCVNGCCRGANKRPSKASLIKTKGRLT